MYNKYAGKGAVFVLLVGQNAWQYPATASDAKAYKQSHGYQSGWISLADPNWYASDKVIYDSSGSLPNMTVLDGTMKLLYTGGNDWSAEGALANAVAGQ